MEHRHCIIENGVGRYCGAQECLEKYNVVQIRINVAKKGTINYLLQTFIAVISAVKIGTS